MLRESIQIRKMLQKDVPIVCKVFKENGIEKSPGYIERCWEENQTGNRISLLAFYHDDFVGSLHLLLKSKYPYFVENGIPEINQLMDDVEQIAFEKYGIIGVGVGMHLHYGQAQRLYAKRGYIPDGRGLTYHNKQLNPGVKVYADDDLILYMTKKI
jgi:hypothetical protein